MTLGLGLLLHRLWKPASNNSTAVYFQWYFLVTRNNQRLLSVGDNDRRSKRFCSNAVLCISFTWLIVKTRNQMTSDRRSKHTWSNCVLCIPLILSASSKWMLATYMQRMHTGNDNLAPVVQKLDNAIHQLNHYPPDKCQGNQLRFPVDSDLSGG